MRRGLIDHWNDPELIDLYFTVLVFSTACHTPGQLKAFKDSDHFQILLVKSDKGKNIT